MHRKISAAAVYPVSSPPVQEGVIVLDESSRILSLAARRDFEPSEIEMHHGILCPGFINAHCHLELSYMEGKIPERTGLVQFVNHVIDYRNHFTAQPKEQYPAVINAAIEKAGAQMAANGIVAVGDISNDAYTFPHKAQSALRYHTFVECYGFYRDQAETYFQNSVNVFHQARALQLPASVTPHAPYSVPPPLFRLIFSFTENEPALFSIHNQETKAENDFFMNGEGDFKQAFEHFKIPLSNFQPTGRRSLESVMGYFPSGEKMLLVHNTETNAYDFQQIQNSKSQLPNFHFCTCPNANLYIENLLPDYALWEKHTGHICIGTDSLASNHTLSVLDEMKTIQKHVPHYTFETLLPWATVNGAAFFGWQHELGTLEAGKKPGINLIKNMGRNGNMQQATVERIA